ncbi:MAG: tyrosine-type recombinase/integrase [Thermoflexales bacterium]
MNILIIPSTAELWARLADEDAQMMAPAVSGNKYPTSPRRAGVARCPGLPALRRPGPLLQPNKALVQHFRNWLHHAGYSAVGRLVYGEAIQPVLGLDRRHWRDLAEPDLAAARAHIAAADLPLEARTAYLRGIDLFSAYLGIGQRRHMMSPSDQLMAAWPAVAPLTLLSFYGQDPPHDTAQSGCIPPRSDARRDYIKSGALPRPLRESLHLSDLPLAPVKRWPIANQAFYQHFRNWLTLSGYGPSAQYLYGLAARALFSLVAADWRDLDPEADIARLRAWVVATYPGEPTRQTYFKGIAKLAEYLRLRQSRALSLKPKPAPPVKPPRRSFRDRLNLPAPILALLDAYFAHCRRNWPAERAAEIASDWWWTISRPLREIRASGVPLEAPEDITPARWYAYADARLASGISPTTLNGELTALRGWLWWLHDDAHPICARMLKVRPLRAPARLPKDLPPEATRALQRAIEVETFATEPGIRRRAGMDLAWFLLMLHSGLRTGEIRRLRLPDLDWERRQVRIEDSKGLRSRLTPFSPQAADALNAWLAVRGEDAELPDTVFFDRSRPLTASYCYQRLRWYGNRCGVRAHPHQLRHTCATLLLNAAMPLPQVQAILGHRQLQTTRDYARSYDGTVAADYTRAMLSLERELGLRPSGPQGLNPAQIVALLDAVRTTGVLNPRQLDDLAEARAGLLHLSTPAAETKPV